MSITRTDPVSNGEPEPAEAIEDASLKPLQPHQTYYYDEDGQRWLVTAWLGRVGDRIEVVGMDVRSFRHDREHALDPYLPTQEDAVKLTAKIWRAAGALKEELRVNYLRELSESGLLDDVDSDVSSAWKSPTNRLPSTHEAIATLYVIARATNQRPAVLIAKELDMSESAASKRILRAQEVGLIPRAKVGRPRKVRSDDPTTQASVRPQKAEKT